MTANPTQSPTQPLHPGDKLGKFEIVGQIGLGGTSTVWKGYDRLLDRFVAIKQINRDALASQEQEAFLEKLRAEVQLQKRIGALHKNLVKVYDLIEEQRGLFIVMEFVDGPTLAQFIAKNPQPMDPRQAIGLVGATALALAAIHKEGAIHRDLKPSNVLLPNAGGLKVCDYGLATLVVDQESLAVGSVRYMAPELFGDRPVDAKVDIYALGMIAYELMAGKEKFEDAFKIVLRDQRNQSMRWMKWHTNPRASAPPLHQINPAIDQRLSELVARMMEKDPDQRIGSAEELLAAIRRHFSGQPSPEEAAQQAEAARVAAMAAAAAAEPTAVLPRKSKWPLILGASLAAQVIVAVVLMVLFNQAQAKAMADRRGFAVNQFNLALADQRKADDNLITPRGFTDQERQREVELFARARKRFDHLASLWANDRELGKPSVARALYCQAAIAYAEARYAEAFDLFKKVEQAGQLDKDFLTTRKNATVDRDNVAAKLRSADNLIQDAKFGDARDQLRKLDRSMLTTLEQERADQLFSKADFAEKEAEIADALKGAIGVYDDGTVMGDAGKSKRIEARKMLADANIKRPDHRFGDQLKAWDRSEKIEALEADFGKSEIAHDPVGMARAMLQLKVLVTEADKVAQYTRRENQVRSEYEYRLGMEAIGAGKMAEAEVHLRTSDRLVPNQDAKDGLKKIANLDERASAVRSGEAALAAEQFPDAIADLQRAQDLQPDSEIAGKLKAAKIGLALQQALTLRQQGNLNGARGELGRVINLDSTNQAAAAGLLIIDKTEKYQSAVKVGDDLRSQGKFSEAKREYVRAQQIIKDSPELMAQFGDEIKHRIDDVEFESLLAKIRQLIAAGAWEEAKAWSKTAGDMRPTPEWKKLDDQIRNHEESQPTPP